MVLPPQSFLVQSTAILFAKISLLPRLGQLKFIINLRPNISPPKILCSFCSHLLGIWVAGGRWEGLPVCRAANGAGFYRHLPPRHPVVQHIQPRVGSEGPISKKVGLNTQAEGKLWGSTEKEPCPCHARTPYAPPVPHELALGRL